MSFESFAGFSSAEPMSEAAFEAFKEKMKAAAAQIAALRKQQAKQKKQEDQLIQILLQFIKSSTNSSLVVLLSRCLEKNIPANFLLSIIQLSHFEIQASLQNFLLNPGEIDALDQNPDSQTDLTFFTGGTTFPLKARITLDNWLKNMIVQAEEYPEKLLRTIYDVTISGDQAVQKTIQTPLVALATHIIEEFLTENGIENSELASREFSEFILAGIAEKIQDKVDNTRLLN